VKGASPLSNTAGPGVTGDGTLKGASPLSNPIEPVSPVSPVFFDLVRQTVKMKINPMMEYIQKLLQDMPPTQKAVLFGHHSFVLKALQKCAEKAQLDSILVNGSVTGKKRTQMFEKFQTDPTCRVAILSIEACGTGIDLTEGSLVVFAELRYAYDSFLQGEARCHRIGQKNQVQVIYILLKGSIEERIWFLVQNKLHKAGLTLDNLHVSFQIERGSAPFKPGDLGIEPGTPMMDENENSL
jgi:SNF2 family DNA or RNA helicase